MNDTPTYDRAARIAKSIKSMIEKGGATSAHVAATTLRLPATTFDQIAREAPSQLTDGTFNISGITFERGDENRAIQERVAARFGLKPGR